MDALSLLRYWRSNNGVDGTNNANKNHSNTTTIVTGVNSQASETVDEEDNVNDHGSFFDLEFSLQGDEEHERDAENEDEDEDDENSYGSERGLKFSVLSGSSGDSTLDVNGNGNVCGSPSDDLFFRGSFVPVEQTTEIDSKPPQIRLSLIKSARVMLLKLRKSKLNAETSESTESNNEQNENNEEITKTEIVSLFKRNNSSKKASEEKKFSKEAMHRYLKKVKISGEKLKFTGQLIAKTNLQKKQSTASKPKSENETTPEASDLSLINTKGLKQGNLPAGLRVVCKHLGKTWSVSTPVTAAAPPGTISSKRRDDSLIQQQDGIQSAILHCKRSFKASRDFDGCSVVVSGKCDESSFSDAADVKETVEMDKR